MADPGEGPGGEGAGSPLCFDQNEARRTEEQILETAPSPPPPSLKVWIRHCAVTSARRRQGRDSEFRKRLKREKINRSQKVCLKESE